MKALSLHFSQWGEEASHGGKTGHGKGNELGDKARCLPVSLQHGQRPSLGHGLWTRGRNPVRRLRRRQDGECREAQDRLREGDRRREGGVLAMENAGEVPLFPEKDFALQVEKQARSRGGVARGDGSVQNGAQHRRRSGKEHPEDGRRVRRPVPRPPQRNHAFGTVLREGRVRHQAHKGVVRRREAHRPEGAGNQGGLRARKKRGTVQRERVAQDPREAQPDHERGGQRRGSCKEPVRGHLGPQAFRSGAQGAFRRGGPPSSRMPAGGGDDLLQNRRAAHARHGHEARGNARPDLGAR